MKNILNNIDWSNHIVAFFSALLGILIAFQLQDYQDDQKEEEELQITLEAIKKEIENNQNIYRTNIKTLTDFLDVYEAMDDKKGSVDIDVPAQETGISTSSWQAGIYSGILIRLDHGRLSKLTHIYEWIEKDIGLNELEFLKGNVLSEFGDLDLIVNYFTKLTKIQQMKLGIVSDYYDQIVWE